MYRKYIKRVIDIVLSALALLALSPVFLVVAFLVGINMGTPILFKQQRPGKNEKIFTLYKFRTMKDVTDHMGHLLSDEVRLTKFGKVLRATSLDELPELFNILNGDMSIVGPRPLLVEYLPRYSEEQRHRHDVRPGLTGLAMSKGRNALTWEEKFNYDIEYVNKISFALDLKIIFYTIIIVFQRKGINEIGHATVSEFAATKSEVPNQK